MHKIKNESLPLSNKCTVGLSTCPILGAVRSTRFVDVIISFVVVTVVGGVCVVGGDFAK